MPNPLPALMLLLAMPMLPGQDDPGIDGAQLAQLGFHQRIIIRIPRLRPDRDAPPRDPPREPRWDERRGPRCVPADALTGAMIVAPDTIDLTTADGTRLRARLDRHCPPMDYYPGFYMKPTSDGMICADRDSIAVRSGGSCPIVAFRQLMPGRRRGRLP